MDRWMVGLGGIAIIALAVLAGTELSDDAMTLIVGIVVGIGVSIPTSLAMLMLLGQRNERPAYREPLAPQPRPQLQLPAAPPERSLTQIVVQPGGKLYLQAPGERQVVAPRYPRREEWQ